MADKPKTDEQEKTVVDRALLESKPRSLTVLFTILTALLLMGFIMLFDMMVKLSDGQAWQIVIGAAPFLILFVILLRQLVKNAAALRALKKGSFTVTQDLITGRCIKNTDNRTVYYLKGAASGTAQYTEVGEKEYYKAFVGEPFWIVTLETKKGPVKYSVYPGASYTVSDALKPFYRKPPAYGSPGVPDSWEEANRLSAAAAGVPEAPRYRSKTEIKDDRIVVDRFTVIKDILKSGWIFVFLVFLFLFAFHVIILSALSFGALFIIEAIITFIVFVFFVVFAIVVLYQLRLSYAVYKKKFLFVQDAVAQKYCMLPANKNQTASYYIKGTAAADRKFPELKDELTYRLVKNGEPFWFVLINTRRRPYVAAVYPCSSYRPADEMNTLLRNPAETVSCSEADPAATIGAQRAAMDELFRTPGPKRAECASCGKKFNTKKHPDACPKCGAARIK